MMRRFVCALVAASLVSGLAPGCLRPTQATLTITTNVPCAELRGVAIVTSATPAVTEERAAFPSTVTSMCEANGTIGTLVVTPGEGDTAAVVIAAGVRVPVESCKPPNYEGCIVARRRFAFVDHVPLMLPIELGKECVDVPCDAQTTCRRGVCVESFIACSEIGCTEVGETPTVADGATDVLDGTPGEAASDAPIDGTTLDGGDGGDGGLCTLREGNAWAGGFHCELWDGMQYSASCGVIYTIPRCADETPYGECAQENPPVLGPPICSQERCSTTWRCLNQFCAYGCVPGGGQPNFDWHPIYTCTEMAGCDQ